MERIKDTPIPCAVCGLPCAYLTTNGMRWMSRHGGKTHWNAITPQQLQRYLDDRYEWYCGSQGGMSYVYHNCVEWNSRRPAEMIGPGKWRCVHCGKVWDLLPDK